MCFCYDLLFQDAMDPKCTALGRTGVFLFFHRVPARFYVPCPALMSKAKKICA